MEDNIWDLKPSDWPYIIPVVPIEKQVRTLLSRQLHILPRVQRSYPASRTPSFSHLRFASPLCHTSSPSIPFPSFHNIMSSPDNTCEDKQCSQSLSMEQILDQPLPPLTENTLPFHPPAPPSQFHSSPLPPSHHTGLSDTSVADTRAHEYGYRFITSHSSSQNTLDT